MVNWWPPEVQAREQRLFFDENKDTWIFRNKSDGIYFAVGGLDSIGINTILMVADVVKFTSQRLKEVDYDPKYGYRRRVH
jgi:hypothetical protein